MNVSEVLKKKMTEKIKSEAIIEEIKSTVD